MDASEIKDAESLQVWLENLPQETDEQRETARRWAVTIAHRAAMRVLPLYWEWSLTDATRELGETALPLLRSCLVSSAAKVDQTLPISEAVLAANADVVMHNEYYVDNGSAADASFTAMVAAHATTLEENTVTIIDRVLDAVTCADQAARDSVFQIATIWDAVSVDCVLLERGQDIDQISLWHETNLIEQIWVNDQRKILDQGDGWGFWVEWYENALYGRPQDYDLLTKIALIDPADWVKGADHVNVLIAQIRLEHIVETRPLGEDAIEIGPDGLWHRTGKSDIDGDILQDAVESVQDEIATLRTKLQGPQGNMFTALVSDLDLLEQRIARHPDRPLRLHDVFIRVQGHIARNLHSGELPDDDCVRDLSSVLGNAALDMCNACDKTKSVVQKRMAVRFDEADEQSRDDLKLIAEGAARISDADLASEFIEDAEVIADEAIPLSEKTSTLYRLQTRLARIVFHDGGNLVKALVLLGGIGGGVATVSWVTMTILRFLFA